MANINQVNVLGTVYDIEDASAQQSITEIQGDIAEINTDLGNKAPLIECTAGPADVATFTDGAAGMPMEVTVALDPIQAGSGEPSPDNVREISGYSGVDVYCAQKNLFNPSNVITGFVDTSAKKITANQNTATVFCKCKPNTTYTISRSVSGTRFVVGETAAMPAANVAVANTSANNTASSMTITTSETAQYIVAFMWISTDAVTKDAMLATVQIELGSTATDYEPYTGSTLSVTFPDPPGTVYGGTLTVNRDGTGKLVVDRGYYAFDGSEEWDTLASAENLYYLNAQSYGNFADVYLNATANDFAISNRYVQRTYAGITSSQNGQFAIGRPSETSLNRRICVKDTACATVDDLKTSLATTPMQLVFRINTPITYDLTAEQVGQITTVKGVNNVWSAGEVEVTYAADTKLYIDGKIASLQAMILENISNA